MMLLRAGILDASIREVDDLALGERERELEAAAWEATWEQEFLKRMPPRRYSQLIRILYRHHEPDAPGGSAAKSAKSLHAQEFVDTVDKLWAALAEWHPTLGVEFLEGIGVVFLVQQVVAILNTPRGDKIWDEVVTSVIERRTVL